MSKEILKIGDKVGGVDPVQFKETMMNKDYIPDPKAPAMNMKDCIILIDKTVPDEGETEE